ncbi:MAG: zinc ribbon domain-containing protein [Chloroflexota bacterium]
MPDNLERILQIAIALVGAYITAFWFTLVVWAFRDIQKRTRDVLVQVLATLLVLLFNLPGLLLYTILRPPETLAEAYARSLEEESLIQEIEERQACSACRQRVLPDYLLCPNCGEQLKQSCPECHRVLNLNWNRCPYCGSADLKGTVPAPLLAHAHRGTETQIAPEPAPRPLGEAR